MLRRFAFGTCLVALAAGCVPRGEPPAGRQLVADRTSTLAGVVPSNGDGTTRVLLTRPGRAVPESSTPLSFELYVVSLDASGGPPVERLLASNLIGSSLDCQPGLTACVRGDARGRVLVMSGSDPSTGFGDWSRIDPFTGERLDLGQGINFTATPSGERLAFYGNGLEGRVTLLEADDRLVPLTGAQGGQFVGEDWYYLTTQQELMRIVPGGVPERLATGINTFYSQQTYEGPLVLLLRRTADPIVSTYAVLDPATLVETPSPLGTVPVNLSPDGRWLLAVDGAAGRATFVNRETQGQDVFELGPYRIVGYEWRPGHDEIWFLDSQSPDPVVWIKKPGEPAVALPRVAYSYADESGMGSFFTRDGVYWFSTNDPYGERPTQLVGSADDPEGLRFELRPAGTASFQYWRLGDGRILSTAWVKSPSRGALIVVDTATGDSRLLGEAGFVHAVGQHRVLASLHVNDSRGDLTVIDPSTGEATVLAPEFELAAFIEQQQAADRVPPGAHVAYQFRARFESPYDGIWLATVP